MSLAGKKWLYVILMLLAVLCIGCGTAAADEIIGEVTVQSDSLTFAGGLHMDYGDVLDLNGHYVLVSGDLLQEGGRIIFNGGSLTVTGSFTCTGSSSSITMDNDSDLMEVYGNFYFNAWYASTFTAGQMFVHGDFIQKTANNAGTFSPSEEHLTVLNGGGNQVVGFGDPQCSFGKVQFTNQDLTIQDHIGWKKLTTDLTAKSDNAALTGSLDFSGHTISVDGNLDIGYAESAYAGDLYLNGGNLIVTGDVVHKRGNIVVSGGEIRIGGAYSITGSASFLTMTDENDRVYISGDVYYAPYYYSEMTAGRLYLGGSMTQRTSNNAGAFNPDPEHTTILNGTGQQLIQFGDAACSFGTLQATNSNLAFAQKIGWKLLNSNLHASSEDGCILAGAMDFSGHTVLIDGNADIKASIDLKGGTLHIAGSTVQSAGQISLGGGELRIDGDYEVSGSGSRLVMENDSDILRVGGDFRFHPYYGSIFTAGTQYFGGNVNVWISNNDGAFACGGTIRTVMDGRGVQTVSIGGNWNHFNILELKRPVECYNITADNKWEALTVYEPPKTVIPGRTTEIGAQAFMGDTSIEYVSFADPARITAIGAESFKGCSSLLVLCVPEGITYIADNAFDGCTGMIFSGCNEYAAAYAEEHGIPYTVKD